MGDQHGLFRITATLSLDSTVCVFSLCEVMNANSALHGVLAACARVADGGGEQSS